MCINVYLSEFVENPVWNEEWVRKMFGDELLLQKTVNPSGNRANPMLNALFTVNYATCVHT